MVRFSFAMGFSWSHVSIRMSDQNAMNVSMFSVREMSAALLDGSLDAMTVLDRTFERIYQTEHGDGALNAFRALDPEGALSAAEQLADHSTSGSSDRRLHGVPVAVKDNIATLRMPTGCASKILEGYISPYEATAITRLRAAGAIVVGKTNMDEFAMGSSTENSAYGATLNPLDRSRVPGGSSGGSAAAVAAGVVRIALGSETGGSVRQPAAFCGIVGVKPTYGRVSRFGLVAFASSLDQIGVFGKTVEDAALTLQIISGQDSFDATSVDTPVPDFEKVVASARTSFAMSKSTANPSLPLKGLVIGKPSEYFPESLDEGIRTRCEEALEKLRELGAEVRNVSLPHTGLAVPVYYVVAPAEASSNLSRFDGVRYGMRVERDGLRPMYEATRSKGFGAEVTRRILLGTYVLSAGYYDAYYLRAQEVRQRIRNDFTVVFSEGVHVLFTPTTPGTAFKLGSISDPYELYLSDVFTVTANLAGVPAMSLPIGDANGLPVGGQLIASHFDEATMFRVAETLQCALALPDRVVANGHAS